MGLGSSGFSRWMGIFFELAGDAHSWACVAEALQWLARGIVPRINDCAAACGLLHEGRTPRLAVG